jgi:hypothetical protein
MPLLPYVVTLTGNVQRLTWDASGRTAISGLSLTGGQANANPVYVGGPLVDADTWVHFIPAATGGIPEAPLFVPEVGSGKMLLEDFYVKGTNGEKLHIGVYQYL